MAEGTIKIKEMEELTELTDNDYFVVDNLQSGVPTKKYKATRVIQMIENVADEIEEKITPSIDTALAVGSVSGDIASFSDGSTLPMPKLQVGIEPQQDLHGYDAPWVGGAGKNKFNIATISVKEYIGENGNLYSSNNWSVSDFISVDSETAYVLSGITNSGSLAKHAFYDSNKVFISAIDSTVMNFTTPSNAKYIRLSLQSETPTNVQLEKGTTATTFAPYSNICPISGWDEVNVGISGVNLFDVSKATANSAITTSGQVISGSYYVSDFISVKPSTSVYILNIESLAHTRSLVFYGVNKELISIENVSGSNVANSFVKEIPNNVYYIRIGINPDYINNSGVNYPSTDTDYHAYIGTTYTTNLPETVYGGTLDVVSGVLTVDRVMKTFSQLSIGYNSDSAFFFSSIGNKKYGVTNIISSCFRTVNKTSVSEMVDGEIKGFPSTTNVYWKDFRYTSVADFITNVGSQQVCYELATPLTYQLSPTQVKSLLGSNNVWCDSGEIIDCEYKRDATAIINSLIARIEALENQ